MFNYDISTKHRFPVKNTSTEKIPPFAVSVLSMTEPEFTGEGLPIFKVSKPTGKLYPTTMLVVNGDNAIEPEGYGSVSQDWPLPVRFRTGLTIVPGRSCGLNVFNSPSWDMHPWGAGGIIMGKDTQNRIPDASSFELQWVTLARGMTLLVETPSLGIGPRSATAFGGAMCKVCEMTYTLSGVITYEASSYQVPVFNSTLRVIKPNSAIQVKELDGLWFVDVGECSN